MAWNTRLDALARRQHGIITFAQLLDCGLAPRTVAGWAAADRIARQHDGVYRVAGAPVTWESRLIAAVLAVDGDCFASHRSAARLWSLYDGDEIDITVQRGRTPRLRGVNVHRPLDFPEQRSMRDGIPVTNPLRTLVDLGAVAHRSVVADAFNEARVRRLVTFDGVERACVALARPGRRGAGVLRRVLDAHALAMEAPDSRLEIRMFALMQAHGLPPARFQYPLKCRRKDYRIDFAYPEVRLAIEVDGFAKRATPEAMAYDLDRQNDLVERGWSVVRFMWSDIVKRPAFVAGRIARLLGADSADMCRIGAETVGKAGA